MASVLNSSKLMAFVATKDATRAKAFYGETLGLPLVSEDPFAVVFNANGIVIRVTPVRDIAIGGYTVLGWEVADINASVAELTSRGVRFELFPGLPQSESGVWDAPGGASVAWFKDPDGNLLSLARHP
jgi:catechol 2,3-dioxygenase-like lactoylglutathione lyase family enzyme